MISRDIAGLAVSHAAALPDHIELSVPNASTLLGAVVETCHVRSMDLGCIAQTGAGGGSDEPERVSSIVNITADYGQDISLHSRVVEAEVDRLAPIVQQHLSVVRNVVKPEVVRFAEAIRELINADRAATPDYRYDIRQVSVPEVVQDDSIAALLVDSAQVEQPPKHSLDLPLRSTEELIAMMMVGRARQDTKISSWAATLEPQFLQRVWLGVFGTARNSGVALSPVSAVDAVITESNYDSLNAALVVALLGNRLAIEVPADCKLSLNDYQSRLTAINRWAASRVRYYLSRILADIKAERLVVSYGEKTIYVSEELYRKFLESGGKPEMLLGSALGQRLNMSSQLMEKGQELIRIWDLHCASVDRAYELTAKHRLVHSITQYLTTFVPCEEGRALIEKAKQVTAGYENEAKLFMLETIRNIDISKSFCEYHLATELVANGLYRFTAGYCILKYMEEISIQMPNMDQREVALLAAVNYIADYQSDMIVIK